MNKELIETLKYLRLGGLLAHWEDYLKVAADKGFSHARLLSHVLEEEYRIKRENARQLRLKRAALPEPLVIETFPFERQPKLNKKKILALYESVGSMQNGQNLIWLGATGCGKTGLATSFLIHAMDQGYSGRYVLFAELIGELYRSVGDHSEATVLKKYLAFDYLLIDEIGYVEVEKPTLITSNLGFSEWGSFLKNDHLTAALIDRLTENSHVINMKGCVSLRAKISPEP